MNWRERAECRGAPIEVFYPGGGKGRDTNAPALAYCRACPVRSECLEHALEEEQGLPVTHRVGVRGGLSAQRRFRLAQDRLSWAQLERAWCSWRLERDRIVLHREVWV